MENYPSKLCLGHIPNQGLILLTLSDESSCLANIIASNMEGAFAGRGGGAANAHLRQICAQWFDPLQRPGALVIDNGVAKQESLEYNQLRVTEYVEGTVL